MLGTVGEKPVFTDCRAVARSYTVYTQSDAVTVVMKIILEFVTKVLIEVNVRA
jgi:protein tyrosine phosphatase (PTP) superfamily phosphohydrolase (DUF442 family)